MEGPISSASRAVLHQGKQTEVLAENPEKGRLKSEIAEFARQLQSDDYESCYKMLAHSLQMMEVLEACKNQSIILHQIQQKHLSSDPKFSGAADR